MLTEKQHLVPFAYGVYIGSEVQEK